MESQDNNNNYYTERETCTKCSVNCQLKITYSESGKLIKVEGNACDRGVDHAKIFIMNKFTEDF